jgi:hypothetical protein
VFARAGEGYQLERFGDATQVERAEADVTHESAKDEEHRREA